MKKCTYCAEEIQNDAIKCKHCGERLDGAKTSAEPVAKGAAAKGADTGRSIGGCLVLLVILGSCWYIVSNGTKPQRSADPKSSPSRSKPAPAQSGPSLELIDVKYTTGAGGGSFAEADGRVKNISSESLKNVEAVVTWFDKNGGFITTSSALIEYNPILPGQTSPFSVIESLNPAMKKASVEFKYLMGGTIETKGR